ncbi:DUF2147 domain-containing protein [Bradyrhizobium ontarionense]|uniref:DUF2147 domain-containing protein n=1 Tax=Bradyrhizobium ontarionense TaxID=2898149 RepID=A0ABY3RHS0_9BRAD|nr:DUF2147 domain-containing protein [Bradyrhizobium sp. A19]UFZ06522.1 DUF2147 domain-containing protein [Bradyrhizobium sp. A19]
MTLRFVLRVSLRIVVSLLLSMAESRGHAAPASDPTGTWLTEDGRARVRIERCGAMPDRLCGYIVWAKEAADARGQPFRDRLNPDPAKRSRLLLGHQMLLGLKPNPDGRYAGEVYNAEDGKTYSVSIWREGPKMLAVKGCLLGLFCATQGWAQVTDLVPGQLVAATGEGGGPVPDREWAAPKPPVTAGAAKPPPPGAIKTKAN